MGFFKGAATSSLQDAWNKSMSQYIKWIFCRTYVELYSETQLVLLNVSNLKKVLKMQSSALGKKIYCACYDEKCKKHVCTVM